MSNSEIITVIIKWWDFMDSDCMANRKEYTEQEQTELINKFLDEIN